MQNPSLLSFAIQAISQFEIALLLVFSTQDEAVIFDNMMSGYSIDWEDKAGFVDIKFRSPMVGLFNRKVATTEILNEARMNSANVVSSAYRLPNGQLTYILTYPLNRVTLPQK